MADVELAQDHLRDAVERMRNCGARLAQSAPVKESRGGVVVWES